MADVLFMTQNEYALEPGGFPGQQEDAACDHQYGQHGTQGDGLAQEPDPKAGGHHYRPPDDQRVSDGNGNTATVDDEGEDFYQANGDTGGDGHPDATGVGMQAQTLLNLQDQ